ncbi:hypothetical protein [Nesterenkonia halotolerans]|uniref:Alpha/beta hydrolase n=1 Tax=Nesterenkonia halotolerans TaxID=225325 RepID=A0ABR9J9V4_9MICC|nr:hypothetical protein [Nesterenkonia halotolerans]MBE1515763.1 hypothetical protein [Nesterenkonia halotolerans]
MKAKKTSIKHLDSVPRHSWEGPQDLDVEERGLYTEHLDGEQYDFIFAPKPETGRLIVFFSGDARRSKFEPPVFQRWSWASKFPASCLYFSDPALYHHSNLGLAWYAGNNHGDYLEHIAKITRSIVQRMGTAHGQVFSYGSSGGGFAALRFARYFKGLRVIAINPQTDLWAYPVKWTNRLARACYDAKTLGDVPVDQQYKFSALDPAVLHGARGIFLGQNEQDRDHYEKHFEPFNDYVESLGLRDRLTSRVFSDASGHAGAENQETFDEIIGFLKAPEPEAKE